ncbi:hypothetical protein B1T34_06390 [Staphylococcus aureus]|nr:hypothetical protein B1T33_05290 [Staphylococcus aureus]PTY49588.1 hypothetical protein B1T34_06390 [Staphylococcus aureus]
MFVEFLFEILCVGAPVYAFYLLHKMVQVIYFSFSILSKKYCSTSFQLFTRSNRSSLILCTAVNIIGVPVKISSCLGLSSIK